MGYTIILSKSVEKEIENLPKAVLIKVDNSILSLEVNPRPNGVIKLTSYSNLFRIRKGNYRFVYTIDDLNKVIEIDKWSIEKMFIERKNKHIITIPYCFANMA
jgi:mRNA interferase RelE/StbE